MQNMKKKKVFLGKKRLKYRFTEFYTLNYFPKRWDFAHIFTASLRQGYNFFFHFKQQKQNPYQS